MGHDYDYGQLMSAALDGRLNTQELAGWNAHRADCPQCQRRWRSLQDVDRLLGNAVHVAPPLGFTTRFAARLAQQRAARQARQRAWVGASLLAAGALLVLLMLAWPLAWDLPALIQRLGDAPAYLSDALLNIAQWVVVVRALSQVGSTLARYVLPWGLGLALIYAGVLLLSWSGLVWQMTRYRPGMAVMREA